MADTDALRTYKLTTSPRTDDGLATFVAFELRDIAQSISLIIEVMKKLEARMTAHGI